MSNQTFIRALWRMDKIIRPRHEGTYPDRDIDCQEAMDIALREIIDRANNAGWSSPEALLAIANVIPSQLRAYAEDPDPADDPV